MNDVFLEYFDHSVDFEDLSRPFLKVELDDGVAVITGDFKLETFLNIARCWLHKIPFVVLDPEQSHIPNHEHLAPLRSGTAACLLSSSGSTGVPKWIALTRQNMESSIRFSSVQMGLDSHSTYLLLLPVFHVGGLMVLLRALQNRCKVVFRGKFEPSWVNIMMARGKFTHTSMVSTMLYRMLKDGLKNVHPNFKCALLGGGTIPKNMIEQCRKIDFPILPSYGMTETAAAISITPHREWTKAPLGTSGKFSPEIQYKIVDLSETPVDAGTIGRLFVSGPQICDGFWQHQAWQHPHTWLETGDFANVDEDDFLFIHSRREDLIVSGGKNIAPTKVEQALLEITGFESIVIGLPDQEWGEQVVAVFEEKNKKVIQASVSLQEQESRLKKMLSRHEIPKQILFVDHFPRTALGKIKRATLKRRIQPN